MKFKLPKAVTWRFGGVYLVDAMASSVGIIILLIAIVILRAIQHHSPERLALVFKGQIESGYMPIYGGRMYDERTNEYHDYAKCLKRGVQEQWPIADVHEKKIFLHWIDAELTREEFTSHPQILRNYCKEYLNRNGDEQRRFIFLIYSNGMYHTLSDSLRILGLPGGRFDMHWMRLNDNGEAEGNEDGHGQASSLADAEENAHHLPSAEEISGNQTPKPEPVRRSQTQPSTPKAAPARSQAQTRSAIQQGYFSSRHVQRMSSEQAEQRWRAAEDSARLDASRTARQNERDGSSSSLARNQAGAQSSNRVLQNVANNSPASPSSEVDSRMASERQLAQSNRSTSAPGQAESVLRSSNSSRALNESSNRIAESQRQAEAVTERPEASARASQRESASEVDYTGGHYSDQNDGRASESQSTSQQSAGAEDDATRELSSMSEGGAQGQERSAQHSREGESGAEARPSNANADPYAQSRVAPGAPMDSTQVDAIALEGDEPGATQPENSGDHWRPSIDRPLQVEIVLDYPINEIMLIDGSIRYRNELTENDSLGMLIRNRPAILAGGLSVAIQPGDVLSVLAEEDPQADPFHEWHRVALSSNRFGRPIQGYMKGRVRGNSFVFQAKENGFWIGDWLVEPPLPPNKYWLIAMIMLSLVFTVWLVRAKPFQPRITT